MLSIVSFSVGAPVMCKEVARPTVDSPCPKILDPDDIIKDMNYVQTRWTHYTTPNWGDLKPLVDSLYFIAETTNSIINLNEITIKCPKLDRFQRSNALRLLPASIGENAASNDQF